MKQLAQWWICAFSASWIPPDIGESKGTVDHFLPKHKVPELAYEWSNFRFCSRRMNGYKDNWEDIMDPFKIRNGWFTIDFASFLIHPGDGLAPYLTQAIQDTITRLHLNDDDDLVQARTDVVMDYVNDEVTFTFLERKYPFIAIELERQGLRDTIKTMLRMPSI